MAITGQMEITWDLEITDETGVVINGDRDFVLKQWSHILKRELPMQFKGTVKLQKTIEFVENYSK